MKKQLAILMGSSFLAIGSVVASVVEVSAATLTNNVSCTSGTVTGTTSCKGAFEGNNSNQNLDGLFGLKWTTDGIPELKVDSDEGTTGQLTIDSKDGTEGTEGTWMLDQSFVDMYDNIMFVLKGGPSFSAYLWDGSSTSGTWNTDGIEKGNGKPSPGLSHFSVYAIPREDNGGGQDIPEPASMVGLVAVGAGIMLNRRKKVQQA